MNLADFVVQHQNDDLSDLVLHRDRYPDVDVALAAECIAARRKLRYKVPEWYADPELICPVALSAEQCSSTATARYKAAVAEEACRLPLEAIREEQRARPCPVKGPRSGHCSSASLQPALPDAQRAEARGFEPEANARLSVHGGGRDGACPAGDVGSPGAAGVLGAEPPQKAIRRIADLTGGLGVDCWQFAGIADRVLYNEMNPLLFEAAKANLGRLGCSNVEFSNLCIDADTLPGLLDSFRPDLVFADPARRSEGRKVFLPEDCLPDVLALQDIVLGRGCKMLLKLSPMADISLMLRKFHCVKAVHVVEADGECKELLLLLEPGFGGSPELIVAIADGCPARTGIFAFSDLAEASPPFVNAMPEPGQIIFEPGPALMKSGALNLLSARYGLRKLGPSAHYLCFGKGLLADERVASALDGYGKFFEIQEVALFSKQALRDFTFRWPDAEVTARALPLSSDELRLKIASLRKKAPRSGSPSALGSPPEISYGTLSSGTGTHLFGVGTSIGRLLIAARRT